MAKKRKQKNYTTTEIQEGLLLLEKNQGNVSKTSKELGLPRTTLTSWRELHSIERYKEAGDEKSVESVTKTRQSAEQAFDALAEEVLPKINTALMLAIGKANDLLQFEPDLNKVNGAIKVLTEAAGKFAGQKDEAQVTNIQQYIQNTQNNYNKNLS